MGILLAVEASERVLLGPKMGPQIDLSSESWLSQFACVQIRLVVERWPQNVVKEMVFLG